MFELSSIEPEKFQPALLGPKRGRTSSEESPPVELDTSGGVGVGQGSPGRAGWAEAQGPRGACGAGGLQNHRLFG